jgi:hypothetical protein
MRARRQQPVIEAATGKIWKKGHKSPGPGTRIDRREIRPAGCAGLALLCALFGWPSMGKSDEAPAATPFRPGITDPAALPMPGWLDVEAGWQRAGEGEDHRRDTIPYLIKLAFTPDWGLLVGGDAHVWTIAQDGLRADGFGDTSVLIKYRIPVAENAAFAIQGGITAPTARDAIGVGRPDYVLTGIFSLDFDPYALDLNLGGSRVGRVEDGEGRSGLAWAASLSRSLTDKWEAAAEFSGEHRKGTRGTALFLVSTSYALTDRIVLDVGGARGLSEDADDWQVFAGITVLLAQLWQASPADD